MKKKKTKFIVGGVIIIIAVGYLIFTGLRSNIIYYYTPTEVLAKVEDFYDKGIRIKGNIEDGSIVWNDNKLDLSFKLTDGKQTIPVTYHGVVPDTFKYGVEVVIEGKLAADHTFYATKLLAKCPSKYEVET